MYRHILLYLVENVEYEGVFSRGRADFTQHAWMCAPSSPSLNHSHVSLSDYVPIGPRFSNLVLQALLVLLKKAPPQVN